MYCWQCGTQVPDDSVFCHQCGARVHRAETKEEGTRAQVSSPVSQAASAHTLRGYRERRGQGIGVNEKIRPLTIHEVCSTPTPAAPPQALAAEGEGPPPAPSRPDSERRAKGRLLKKLSQFFSTVVWSVVAIFTGVVCGGLGGAVTYFGGFLLVEATKSDVGAYKSSGTEYSLWSVFLVVLAAFLGGGIGLWLYGLFSQVMDRKAANGSVGAAVASVVGFAGGAVVFAVILVITLWYWHQLVSGHIRL